MDPRKKFRRMVSLKKKRFQDEDFDLDLAYITDRIIAFGFPAEGREALFRNPMPDCQRFFETKHKDHYYIYNLCIEKDRQYKEKKFHNRVGKYQWHDHNAPPLELIPAFCEHAGNWLDEDPENVVAVHCKAGKGRTGVLITCLLLYLKMYDDADEAMDFYGKQRTHNGKGVTIPSQRRFIRYYSSILAKGMPERAPVAFLKELRIEHLSTFENTDFSVGVECNMMPLHRIHKGMPGYPDARPAGSDLLQIEFNCLPLTTNTKIIIYDAKKATPLCWFWFHCAFVGERLHLLKPQIDGAVGDREHVVFPENFAITVTFDTSEAELLGTSEEKGKKSKKGEKKSKKSKKSKSSEPEGEKAAKGKKSKKSKEKEEEKEEKEGKKQEASEEEKEASKEEKEATEEEKKEEKDDTEASASQEDEEEKPEESGEKSEEKEEEKEKTEEEEEEKKEKKEKKKEKKSEGKVKKSTKSRKRSKKADGSEE